MKTCPKNKRSPAPARRNAVVAPPLCAWVVLIGLGWPAPECAAAGDTLRPQDATRGSLWLRSDRAARYLPAPTLDTDVGMEITGMLARVRVRQRFTNPGQSWAEGVYVFPLPEHAAVDHMRLRIGERVVEGRIKERAEAKRTYERAKRAGKKSSLVEQERPNVFTTSLANIAPAESVTVEIEYQQTVRYLDGAFRLRFPTVVGPRYIPGAPLDSPERVAAFSGTGWARATAAVPDAARVTPPVRHPEHGPINPLSLDIRLNAGMPLAEVFSPYHAVTRTREASGVHRVRLTRGAAPADRDFELVWRPQTGSAPSAGWFVQRTDEQEYGLLMVVPPQRLGEAVHAAREVVLVIDNSGSMHGDSIAQARAAVLLALERLNAADRFNVIRFNHTAESLFTHPRPANAHNLAAARTFVNRLRAEGGTVLLPALQSALSGRTAPHGTGQVVFVTDGSVGNEQQLFREIRDRLGDRRLFTVGIGSAPNGYFMRKAAEYGRGTYTYIGKRSEVMEKTAGLFRKLERLALSDLRVELPPDTRLEMLPERIPDLYLGEPLLLAFRGRRLPPWITLHGRFGDRAWRTQVTLEGGGRDAALAPEWGRRKIAQLMTRLHDARTAEARRGLRQEVVGTAIAHHLVSRYTSLVAVDVTPVRARNAPLDRHALETNLPKGWSYEHVFGAPQTATPARLQLLLGTALLLLAAGAHHRRRRTRCRHRD